MLATRESVGTPGWPGPPGSTSSTPRGALALSAAPTARWSVPRTRPEWSSGTSSVEQVNPGAWGHGCGSRSAPAAACELAPLNASNAAAASQTLIDRDLADAGAGGSALSGNRDQALDELGRRDRQVAHPHARRVEDRVRDRGGSADDPDLADPLRPHRVQVRVVLVDPCNVDRRDIGVDGDVVAGQVVVRVVAELLVDAAFLEQRHRDPHRHPAEELRAGRLRVDDPAAREDAGRARDAHLAGVDVDAHLDELRAERVPRKRLALVCLDLVLRA